MFPGSSAIMRRMFARLVCLPVLFLVAVSVFPQSPAREREIAAAFAPVFHQALGDKPRSDYITNFDFDGDWQGDNNWDHADDPKFPLKAYVYYAVSETATHSSFTTPSFIRATTKAAKPKVASLAS